MTDISRKYDAYGRFVHRMLLLAGLLPGDKDQNTLYACLPTVAAILNFCMMCLTMNFCISNASKLGLLTKGMSIGGSFSAATLKAGLFGIYRAELYELSVTLDDLMSDTLHDQQFKPMLTEMMRYFYIPAYIQVFLIMGVALPYFIAPIIIYVYQVTKHVDPKRCVMPFPSVFPWIIEGCGPFYQAHYVFEVTAGWFLMNVTSGVDTVFGYYVLQISHTLQVLAHRIENLRHSDPSESVIKDIVIKHNKLIRCCRILEKVYGPIVLWMTIMSAFIMCALIFQAFQTTMTVVKAVLFVIYMVMKMAQNFMYAWYGAIVTNQSELLRRSAYNCKWFEWGNNSFARGILIILSQKPIRLTAFSFFCISVDLFIGVLNKSISYFFLLKTLDDPK